jgi:hypothetical protein
MLTNIFFFSKSQFKNFQQHLLNFGNFGIVIQRQWQTVKTSISQLPTFAIHEGIKLA